MTESKFATYDATLTSQFDFFRIPKLWKASERIKNIDVVDESIRESGFRNL